MNFLIDTNVWMELIRERPLADDVRSFFATVPADNLCISLFSVHGLGVLMRRHRLLPEYPAFLTIMSIGQTVKVVYVAISDLGKVAETALHYELDFDDAYQYFVAKQNGLRVVSFDADFDRTPDGRLTPASALHLFKDESKT